MPGEDRSIIYNRLEIHGVCVHSGLGVRQIKVWVMHLAAEWP